MIRQVFFDSFICSHLISVFSLLKLMQNYSYVAIFSFLLCGFVHTAEITVKFSKDLSTTPLTYSCSLINQTYLIDDVTLRVLGSHKRGLGNADVTIFNASHSQDDLQKFPTLIMKLFKNLNQIYLEEVNLKVLDESSFNASANNLETLVFGEDNIQHIDSGAFKTLINLQTLSFDYNVIDNISDDAFIGLSNLKSLTFNGNNFTSFSSALLKPLTSLTHLSISDNPITQLSDDTFTALTRLSILNLSNNDLRSISSSLFSSLSNLKLLDLSGNNINSIETGFLITWPSYASLNLVENECVDKDFDQIGSEVWPLAVVEDELEKCFVNYEDDKSLSEKTDDSVEVSSGGNDEETGAVATNSSESGE